jgi:hypothetical protein
LLLLLMISTVGARQTNQKSYIVNHQLADVLVFAPCPILVTIFNKTVIRRFVPFSFYMSLFLFLLSFFAIAYL